jgi:dihydropteroate synthase
MRTAIRIRQAIMSKSSKQLKCGKFRLTLGEGVLVMGVLNVTPDSFSDGGRYLDVGKAVARAKSMEKDGADIIDIGGESTRPGARKVPAREELRRVLPVIGALSSRLRIPISIDTYKSQVAREAIDAGAVMVNDITALRGDEKMTSIVAESGVPAVLMHMRGTSGTMQRNPHYQNVMGEICSFLKKRSEFATRSGIDAGQIIIDPGIGFGKRLEDNIEIIRSLGKIKKIGYPVLVGPSRKSFIGTLLGLPSDERLEGTLAAVTACVLNGADIVRVHDVKEVARAVKVSQAILGNRRSGNR